MRININSIKILERIRQDVRKVDELAANIAKNGLISPIAVMETEGGEFQLLAGLRRVRAVQSLGWADIEANVLSAKNAGEELNIEISENEQREEFTSAEKLDYARQLERLEALKAKERMLSGKKIDDNPTDPGPQGRRETRDVIGAKVGLSGRQYDRLKYIGDNAPQEVLEEIDSGARTIRGTYDEFKAKEKSEKAANSAVVAPKNIPLRDKPVEPVKYAAPLKIVSEEECAAVDNETEAEPEAAQLAEQAPKELPPEKPKRQTAAQRREEKELACLSPKDRAAIEQRRAFDAMTDKEKVADLEKRLSDERFRADTAESELAREKELHKNTIYHRDGTITNQRGQIERLTKALDEVCAERDELKVKVAELEKVVENSVVNDSNNTTIHF